MHTLIDTHAHLYSHKFDHDRHDMVRRAIATGVTRMYLPNIDAESIEGMLQLEADFPENCFAMMGLHPCSVQPDTYETELALVEKWLGQRAWAGIGETGIDLYWDKTTLEIQQIAFARQCEWAKDLNLPIIIHSRVANREAIEVVRKAQDGRLRGIFHCFSGTLEEAKEMIELGFMLGVGGTLTYPKSELPSSLARYSTRTHRAGNRCSLPAPGATPGQKERKRLCKTHRRSAVGSESAAPGRNCAHYYGQCVADVWREILKHFK